MRRAQQLARGDERMGGTQRAKVLESTVADFKQQLEFGLPTAEAEAALRHLARQLRSRKARIKLFLEYPLHAKLYVVHREVHGVPLIDYIGSSNLTLAGLTGQGELNIDVVEQDAASKLADWFEERWENPLSEDISDQLAELIEKSWAGEGLRDPYLVYLKMAYHLSADARVGETQFKLPEPFAGVLLDYQDKAVRLVCRKLYRHGGGLLADVVGLGKTMMAAAVAKTFQEDDRSSTLIICPPKLESMWHGYRRKYGLHAEVLSLGKVVEKLPDMVPIDPRSKSENDWIRYQIENDVDFDELRTDF
jgi:SNF2 family DNA or RNA helicase